jgi:hypothetical protein
MIDRDIWKDGAELQNFINRTIFRESKKGRNTVILFFFLLYQMRQYNIKFERKIKEDWMCVCVWRDDKNKPCKLGKGFYTRPHRSHTLTSLPPLVSAVNDIH